MRPRHRTLVAAAAASVLALVFAPVSPGREPEPVPAPWSFAPRTDPGPPAVSDEAWPQRPLDRFVLAKIEAAGHRPSPQANRATLARRAHLDLLGLPATAEEVDAFTADPSPDAWPRLVDRLLGSPRYGERWGRHWLDVARYADSNGMDEDVAHPDAFRYRDYVIDAFNRDLPFDQFIIEQLAGDLLPADDLAEERRQTTAVGFLSVGPKMLACDDPDKMRRDIVDDQIDTTGRAFIGMTLGCARCHEHKFDPFSIEDYYGLAGVFMSTKTLTKYSVVAEIHAHDLTRPEARERHDRIAELEALAAKEETPAPEKATIESEIATLRENLPPRFRVFGVTEYPTEDARVHLRGDYLTLGDVVPRRLPVALAGDHQPEMPAGQSGRLELARWIASPEHPLTARVIANRVWHWHFGRGIVPTPDNFGNLGTPPSHPGLLDHLASFLVENGWSIKALHREIMLSATYQRSADAPADLRASDPENKLFARWERRRVESEVLRDSILARSGRLDPATGGSMMVLRPNKYVDRSKRGEHLQSTRRTVYLPVLRSSGYDGQNVFDFPDPASIAGARQRSTVALQALFLTNSPLVHESAQALAELTAAAAPPDDPGARARWLVRRVFARDATPAEVERIGRFVAAYPSGDTADAWAAMARALLATNEFLYIE